MPLAVDALTPDSSQEVIDKAVSDSISQCMNEPIPEGTDVTLANKQEWCTGKAFGIARQNTGKSLGRKE